MAQSVSPISVLYRDAEKAFGAEGMSEIATLTGIYHTVCGILNVFDVPAP